MDKIQLFVQLILILFENCLILCLPAESSYIMMMHCLWLFGVYLAGIYCPESKIWKVCKHSLKCKTREVEFNSCSWSFLRNSLSQMFFKLSVLKTFANFTRKQLCWSIFFIKFIKNRLRHRVFPVKFGKVLKTRFL